jgi:energy-coupling factor transport system ATP-binding protein
MKDLAVDIKGLSFTYRGASCPALKDINLEVEPGEFITLTGASGCGKSTLALCLTGFIPHAFAGSMSGTVLVNGLDTRETPPGKLAGIAGLVQQDPELQLCTLKVMDEVAFGPENLRLSTPEIARRVHWSLAAVGAEALIDRDVHTLSGGEKQRVAVAAVLAMHPSLLILDEPTANLDPRCTGEVLQVLQKLRREQGTAIITIEHRLENLLPLSDRLLLMDKGILREEYKRGNFPAQKTHFPIFKPWVSHDGGPNSGKGKAAADPLIRVEGLHFSYGDKPLLKDVSFTLQTGEITAVMGDNGSGKTTLLHALLGLISIEQGKIFFKEKRLQRQRFQSGPGPLGSHFKTPTTRFLKKPSLKRRNCLPFFCWA